MNATTNAVANVDTFSPINMDELDEFKSIMGYCDTNSIKSLAESFVNLVSVMEERNRLLAEQNDQLVRTMRKSWQDQSDEISKTTNQMMSMFKETTDNMTTSFDNISKTISTASDMQRKMFYANFNKSQNTNTSDVKNDPRFVNTLSDEKCSEFLKNFNKAAKMIGNKRGVKQQDVIYSIYKKINSTGDNIFQAYNDYKRYYSGRTKMITMCCHSDHYRTLLEKYIREDLIKEFPDKYTVSGMVSKPINSMVLLSYPKKAVDLVNKYNKKYNYTFPGAANSLYHKLGKRLNINLKDEAKKYARSLGYKNCSTSYYIANHEECIKALIEIIAEEK